MFWIILIIVIILLWKKSGTPAKNAASSHTQQFSPPRISNVPIDENVVDNVVFLTSVTYALGNNHNPNLMNNSINHCYIRCAAGTGVDNEKPYVSCIATTYNIYKGWDEFFELLSERTEKNATKFLQAAGFHSVNALTFLRYIELTEIDTCNKESGFFTVKYQPIISSGSGKAYYGEIFKRLNSKWPYLMKCELNHIDISL